MNMGGSGGSGLSYSSSSEPPEDILDKKEREEKEAKQKKIAEENILASKVKEQEPILKQEFKKHIEKNKNNIPWDYNNHGEKHMENVVKNVDDVIKKYSEISIVKENLNRDLSKLEIEILHASAILHDIGRGDLEEKRHSVASANLINKIKELSPEIRDRVKQICLLHNKEGIESLGGNNLQDLVDKNKISKETAFLARLLSNADALDAGKSRVMVNTQGESRTEVMHRIETSQKFSQSQKDMKLSHWNGHWGFSKPDVITSDNHIGINIRMDENFAKNHPEVSHRISDLIYDFKKDAPKTKKNEISIILRGKDLNSIRTWFDQNKFILTRFAKESDFKIEKAED